MKYKATNDFTAEEKEMMDTITVNYVIAQSDGFQLGYAQALSDFTEAIIDYWEGSDDKPQQCILDLLVDMGVNLGQRREVTKKNVAIAKERGYEQYYNWQYKDPEVPYGRLVGLYTKMECAE